MKFCSPMKKVDFSGFEIKIQGQNLKLKAPT